MSETIELAGDERTLEEIAEAFGNTLGHDVQAVHVPLESFRESMGDELDVSKSTASVVLHNTEETIIKEFFAEPVE